MGERTRTIDVTNLPDGDGYRVVARDGTAKLVRTSDGTVWDGRAFVASPPLVCYAYAVVVRATDEAAGRAAIEAVLRPAKVGFVSADPVVTYTTRGEA